MLPIVGAALAPFAIYQTILTSRVIRIRRGNRISLDYDMGDKVKDKAGPDPLRVAIRSHANHVESVPLALIIAAVAELNGANKTTLGLSLALLFVARVLHVEYGLLRSKSAAGFGRPFGVTVTQGFIISWALACLWLVRRDIF